MTGPAPGADRDAADELARRVAERVAAHPAVVRLDGGIFGAVATYLPGHRLVGVRVDEHGGPVEVAVVLSLAAPIPEVVAQLRARVAAVAGGRPVDVTVSDVVTGPAGPDVTVEIGP
ncbi:hypothetical protein LWC35_24715 [Pseudonocardia kujensis]|uniref:hypothetical protein n=1 Tax=Pseudonocardia kujensis TaxID=1128675 RepID=UPI001E312493|nr:hypothetical protein [Pseudonocardia kujensis]MCE0766082.1 hypothetical protein [Pseudonocardia kujensis]